MVDKNETHFDPPDLKIKVIRDRAFITRKAYYRLEQDGGNSRLKNGIIWTNPNEEFKIKFALVDRTNAGLSYNDFSVPPAPEDGPIWITLGSGTSDCPQNHFIHPDFDVKLDDDGKREKVIVRTPRTTARKNFVYRLRISDSRGRERDFDPVIQNGGGPPLIGWFFALAEAFGAFFRRLF